MGAFFRKDVLLLWRNRQEMLIMLLVPLLMSGILGLAVPGWIEGNPDKPRQAKAAIVLEDDAQAGLDRFKSELGEAELSADRASELAALAETTLPTELLRNMLGHESVRAWFDTVDLNAAEALRQLKEEQVAAVITVPADFTYAALRKMLLNEGDGAALALNVRQQASLHAGILQDMLTHFARESSFGFAIANATGAQAEAASGAGAIGPEGGVETIGSARLLNSFQYFSIAIGMMMTLFISSTVAARAFGEKRERVYERIVLSRTHSLRYLGGKAAAAFCISFFQLAVVIGLTQLIMQAFPGRSAAFWFGMLALCAMLAVCVACLAVLFTSLAFYLKDAGSTGLFSLLLMVLAIAGGNLVPIYILPQWIQQIGLWTPNGLSLSLFMHWIQYETFDGLLPFAVKLAVFGLLAAAIGAFVFPRRGRMP